jgi:hypothetical protein
MEENAVWLFRDLECERVEGLFEVSGALQMDPIAARVAWQGGDSSYLGTLTLSSPLSLEPAPELPLSFSHQEQHGKKSKLGT